MIADDVMVDRFVSCTKLCKVCDACGKDVEVQEPIGESAYMRLVAVKRVK